MKVRRYPRNRPKIGTWQKRTKAFVVYFFNKKTSNMRTFRKLVVPYRIQASEIPRLLEEMFEKEGLENIVIYKIFFERQKLLPRTLQERVGMWWE